MTMGRTEWPSFISYGQLHSNGPAIQLWTRLDRFLIPWGTQYETQRMDFPNFKSSWKEAVHKVRNRGGHRDLSQRGAEFRIDLQPCVDLFVFSFFLICLFFDKKSGFFTLTKEEGLFLLHR